MEEKLPFNFKNKEKAQAKDLIDKQRVAVLREPNEAKVKKLNFKINLKEDDYLVFVI